MLRASPLREYRCPENALNSGSIVPRRAGLRRPLALRVQALQQQTATPGKNVVIVVREQDPDCNTTCTVFTLPTVVAKPIQFEPYSPCCVQCACRVVAGEYL